MIITRLPDAPGIYLAKAKRYARASFHRQLDGAI